MNLVEEKNRKEILIQFGFSQEFLENYLTFPKAILPIVCSKNLNRGKAHFLIEKHEYE